MDVILEHREVMRYLFKALARKYTKLTIKTLVCDIKNAQTLKIRMCDIFRPYSEIISKKSEA